MSHTSFDVVLVPFPFADRLAEKVRPAVVVSRTDMPAAAGMMWLAMITSSSDLRTGDVEVGDLTSAGLRLQCRVRTSKVTAIDPGRILSSIGRLHAVDARNVAAATAYWLARSPD